MTATYYTDTPAYRLHQLADLVDALPVLGDESKVLIHADADSLQFHLHNPSFGQTPTDEEKLASVREVVAALANIGVTGWNLREEADIDWMDVEEPRIGFESFTIFADHSILEEALSV